MTQIVIFDLLRHISFILALHFDWDSLPFG
jgi:hypothetical protein